LTEKVGPDVHLDLIDNSISVITYSLHETERTMHHHTLLKYELRIFDEGIDIRIIIVWCILKLSTILARRGWWENHLGRGCPGKNV